MTFSFRSGQIFAYTVLAVLMSCSPEPGRFKHIVESRQIAGPCFPSSGQPIASEIQAAHMMDRDEARLRSLSAELAAFEKEMLFLQQNVGLFERGFYTADEHDKIENLLARYLRWREELWEMLDYYADYRERFADSASHARGFLIGFGAAVELVYAAARMITLFMDEPTVVAKINEPQPRSNIPAGMFDSLFQNVTAVEHIEALKAGWILFCREKDDSLTPLYRLLHADSSHKAFESQLCGKYDESIERIQYMLENKSLLLPSVTNRLRHSRIAALAQQSYRKYKDNLYAARGLLFEHVSRIKSPGTLPVRFTRKDIRRIHSSLQPGDLIFTYTAGYMSNLFLPGQFKHGITYIGSLEQRRAAGLLDPGVKPPVGAGPSLEERLAVERLPNGLKADVIESVAEGVIFNSLDFLLKTHINRMVVLRPRLTASDRRDALLTTFQLLGTGYDFKFDFNDATFLCCTEVIYRAYHGRGKIDFPLTIRVGAPTLSADDIVARFLSSSAGPFELVLLAEEDPAQCKGQGRILFGNEGLLRLRELMK